MLASLCCCACSASTWISCFAKIRTLAKITTASKSGCMQSTTVHISCRFCDPATTFVCRKLWRNARIVHSIQKWCFYLVNDSDLIITCLSGQKTSFCYCSVKLPFSDSSSDVGVYRSYGQHKGSLAADN